MFCTWMQFVRVSSQITQALIRIQKRRKKDWRASERFILVNTDWLLQSFPNPSRWMARFNFSHSIGKVLLPAEKCFLTSRYQVHWFAGFAWRILNITPFTPRCSFEKTNFKYRMNKNLEISFFKLAFQINFKCDLILILFSFLFVDATFYKLP